MRKVFTLIELLVCVAIIAILSTIAIIAIGNPKGKSIEMNCDIYKYSSLQDIPAMCVSHFTNQTISMPIK